MELDRNQHSVYLLNYHLVMVVKYRRKVINDEISEYLKHRFV
ncbi:IS200/IS605 family transposase, partial [Lactobacillus reuteri]